MKKNIHQFIATAALALTLLPSAYAGTLKIGVVPGAYADSILAATQEAKAQGINVEVVEFTDWTTPNVALNSGDIDINYFQQIDGAQQARFAGAAAADDAKDTAGVDLQRDVGQRMDGASRRLVSFGNGLKVHGAGAPYLDAARLVEFCCNVVFRFPRAQRSAGCQRRGICHCKIPFRIECGNRGSEPERP